MSRRRAGALPAAAGRVSRPAVAARRRAGAAGYAAASAVSRGRVAWRSTARRSDGLRAERFVLAARPMGTTLDPLPGGRGSGVSPGWRAAARNCRRGLQLVSLRLQMLRAESGFDPQRRRRLGSSSVSRTLRWSAPEPMSFRVCFAARGDLKARCVRGFPPAHHSFCSASAIARITTCHRRKSSPTRTGDTGLPIAT